MSSLFKRDNFFSAAEKERIVEAIRQAELQTSGEIRVFVERKNPMVDPVDRARQVFHKLKMEHTRQRNGVLLYIAVKHHELALYGDTGIHEKVGAGYWKTAIANIIQHFKENNLAEAIVKSIRAAGDTLKEKFPYDHTTDKNELPGDIVFGE
ncbi:MAG: TPM domain-containing protein [Ferruginibacter sp.]